MNVKITPHPLSGSIPAIPSKSDVHRLLICAALADRGTEIRCPAVSEDINATAEALSALGAGIEYRDGAFFVEPVSAPPRSVTIDCGESGSTLRFMLPVVTALCERAEFSGRGRLPERPIKELIAALEGGGVRFSSDRLPFSTEGLFRGGLISIPGNISSQYITGLLLALPLTPEGGEVRLTTPLESASYVRITLRAMSHFGVKPLVGIDRWTVPAGARYVSPLKAEADGDWSNAAFFLAAGVDVTGLDPDSPQGDRVILNQLRSIRRNDAVISLADTPDSLPALAAAAAYSGGKTVFTDASRLRLKESDRIKSVREMLEALGGRAEETADGLTVYGTGLRGGTVSSSGDHRIAMAAAIAGAYASDETVVCGAEAVNKSYPGFWDDFRKLGGIANVI